MNTAFARRQMVAQQIRTWDVFDDGVLALFDNIPRDAFVPPAYRQLAYADFRMPLGYGEFMMTPSVEGRVLQALDVGGQDRVLEVGTGSGFLTACLATLARKVTSIDRVAEFVDAAGKRLDEQGIGNVSLAVMDAADSLPDGDYDVIAITGSMPAIDPRFIEALGPGGRLFVVTGSPPIMDAQLITKGEGDAWQTTNLFESLLGRLHNFDEPAGFRF